MYGGMFINDLGSFHMCRELGFSDYGLFSANITRVPLTLWYGSCLPTECTQSDFQEVTKTMSGSLTALYQIFAPQNDSAGVFHPWTTVEVKVIKTDEQLESWRSNTKTGFIMITMVAIPVLILLGLIPTIYHTCLK